MKLTIERLPESRVQLEISAEEEETAEAMRRAVRKVGNQITLPGFRKGKAPRAMIEKAYGPDVFEEEANRFLMTDLYRRALETEDLAPVGEPEVDITSTAPLTYTVIVPVYPTIEPGDYRSVRFDPIDATVNEEAVDTLIEALRKSHSPWIDPAGDGLQVGADLALTPKSRHPLDGDQITIDYTVLDGEEDAEEPVSDAVFVLGESGLLQAVEDAIKGIRVGETTGFSLPFAEDDETVDASVRGKTLSYNVTLKGLKERDLLPLDDDFAKTVVDVDTIEELRKDVREDLHQRLTGEARAKALAGIVEKIAEGATIDLPAPMIDQAVEDEIRRLRGTLAQQGVSLEAYLRASEETDEGLRAELRPAAHERLRNSLLMRAIAEKEEIAVDEDVVNAAVERMARVAYDSQQPQQAEAFARSGYLRNMLQTELFERQLTDRIIELATEGRGAVINGWVAPVLAEAEVEVEEADPAENAALSSEDDATPVVEEDTSAVDVPRDDESDARVEPVEGGA